MAYPSNDPPDDPPPVDPPDRRDVAAEIEYAIRRRKVGDFGPWALLLADLEVPWAAFEQHRASMARDADDVKLTAKARRRRMKEHYTAKRDEGLTAELAADEVAESWSVKPATIANAVNRSEKSK